MEFSKLNLFCDRFMFADLKLFLLYHCELSHIIYKLEVSLHQALSSGESFRFIRHKIGILHGFSSTFSLPAHLLALQPARCTLNLKSP